MTEDLLGAWRLLIGRYRAAPAADQTGRDLLTAWGEPHRRYHGLTHLRDVLAGIDELGRHASDPDATRLAAWYHDAVYRGRPDDEENSARRAESDLAAIGLPPRTVGEVARLVRLTVTHDPSPGDRNGEVLCDADLAILAAAPAEYAAYVAAVRAEYAHVPDAEFAAGRAKVLRALLAAPRLYRTPSARERWETSARANLAGELSRQRSGE